ncbi:MAG: response regulator, partial [Lentisphaeraceae bacterium]|nr:response regulator [Lentisphaeraceae bacterium]
CTTERLVAVISLLSFEELDEEQLKLLELICENLGVIIANLMSQKQTEKYLEEARKTGDQLQKQQEELKVANEELEEQTEELRQSQEKLQLQSEELKAANEELEEKAELLEKQTIEVKKQNAVVEKAKKDIEGKAQELALASKYKSEFLANMSHELRTPLNSLLILADSLIINENDHLDEEEVESAKIIHNSGIELLDLINDILDLSKVEAGKMHLNLEQVSLKPMFENMAKQFKPLADQKGIDFLLDISDDCPASVLTDSQRVRQVIKNLVSNAMKFTKEGSVTIKVFLPGKETEFQTSLKHGASVGIAVEDTGIGIPEEKQEAIFEAFQQADGSTSRNYGGTGLGLAISREFSKLLGGEMQLYSKEGQGSCFTLFIPAETDDVEKVPAKEKEAAKKTKTASTIDDSKEIEAAIDIFPESCKDTEPKNNLVLIIEDDINFAQILKKEVVKREYEVLIAVTGAEGLKIANDLQPVAVLLDLGLPDMDGLQVLDQLKFHMRTKQIPVHIISGSEKEEQSLEKGAVGFLQKPASVKGINSALNKLESVFQKQIKKLLVVEDDPGSQRALKTLISRDDVKISGYTLGKDALAAVEKEEFDCVILDLSLPDMDGFEFLELLDKKEMKHPPVVIYTGRDLSREEHKKLQEYTGSIIIKGKGSSERLLDEVALFLHSVNCDPMNKDKTHSAAVNTAVLGQKTVLLVDDDFRNTFALAKLLQRSHMKVTVAENGALALEELKKATFDIVLMDIMMPVMDGYEAMTKIREHEAWENLPIIALTAKAMPEDRSKCIEAGANDYLTKPVNKDELLTLMSLWLNK